MGLRGLVNLRKSGWLGKGDGENTGEGALRLVSFTESILHLGKASTALKPIFIHTNTN